MRTIKVEQEELLSDKVIEEVARRIKEGEVIAYPTDTVYGLGCSSTADEPIERVYRIKQRDKDKPLLVLVSDRKMASDFFHIDRRQQQVLDRYWPGPYTFLLREKGYLSSILAGNDRIVGARLPKNEFIIKMVNRVREPIVSTSLNIAGREILTSPVDIEKEFSHCLPDLAVDIGRLTPKRTSTLMDITDPSNIKVLRE
mgnify:CR=1 FL=1